MWIRIGEVNDYVYSGQSLFGGDIPEEKIIQGKRLFILLLSQKI